MWLRVRPEMAIRLVRLFSPATILTAESGTANRRAKSRRKDSLARSSTGGAVSRTFSDPACSPSMVSRLARGETRTEKETVPEDSVTSILRPRLGGVDAHSARGGSEMLRLEPWAAVCFEEF